MTKSILPYGFIVKYVSGKPGMVTGMFWGQGGEIIFLCDDCSVKELRAMEPPLEKIDIDWVKVQKELYDRGINVAVYHQKTPVVCKKCGLIVPVNLEQV